MAKEKESTKKIKVDTASGSRSYNRFEIQISQTLHMAIELYEEINYLLILDYYDDITVFDLDAEPLTVSYYQMKTGEKSFTIDSAIKKNWIAKLYEQLSRPEDWFVKELGLITNVPLEVKYKLASTDGKKLELVDSLTSDHTPFTKLHQTVQDRIRADIAEKLKIKQEEVDLSKFAHLRTTLSVTSHRDLSEKEMSDFLYGKYPKITIETAKGIYAAMIELLSRRQSYETLPKDAELSEVRKYKGVTRDDFNRVINQAIVFAMPEYDEVEKYLIPKDEERARVSLAYVTLNGDRIKTGNQTFYELFKAAQAYITSKPYNGENTVLEYCQEATKKIQAENPLLCIPYDEYYIPVLITCLIINKTRR